MRLVFLYGPVAAGKLTVARLLADRTGLALFHNHLIVDAALALFPFGSEAFTRLRERLWMESFREAAEAGRSLIFTFAPEGSVAADFPQRVAEMVEAAGGEVIFVALTLSDAEQERRLDAPSRAAFGKLTSVDLLRELKPQFDACLAAMPAPALSIDTEISPPDAAAERIARLLG